MNYRTYIEAHAAAQKLREQHASSGIMVKIVKSIYGGYTINLIPVDLIIDNLSRETPNARQSRTSACY